MEASWTPVNGHGVTYKVCYSIAAGDTTTEPLCIAGITEPKTVLFPLIPGTTYSVRIAAQNRIGLGDYSYRQLITTYEREITL